MDAIIDQIQHKLYNKSIFKCIYSKIHHYLVVESDENSGQVLIQWDQSIEYLYYWEKRSSGLFVEQRFHAFFSLEANLQIGYCLYLNLKGEQVKTTCVTNTKQSGSHWKDEVYIGQVTKFISNHHDPKESTLDFFKPFHSYKNSYHYGK